MKILLTGAFGNIGVSTLTELVSRGYRIRCFDLKSRVNQKIALKFGDKIETIWGDLRSSTDIERAVEGYDVVIHLAFVIPKLSATGVGSEEKPDLAQEINIGGTKNLLQALKKQVEKYKIVFSSSLHIYGDTHDQPPPRTVDDPVPIHPTEHYSRHKVICERLIRESGLQWTILRFAAALPFSVRMDPAMFTIPLSNRMEYVHTRDVGLAVANAVSSNAVWGKVLLIGGGSRCQYYYRDIVSKVLDATGIGMLPEEAFGTTPFNTDWLDTTESQRILDYQRHTLENFTREFQERIKYRRFFIRLIRPFIRAWLLSKSSAYKKHCRHKLFMRCKRIISVFST